MRRWIVSCLVSLLFAGVSSATTLSGTARDAAGNVLTISGRAWFELSQSGTVLSSGGCGGPYQVGPGSPVSFRLTAGVLTPGTIVGNDCISPANTYYKLTIISSAGTVALRKNVTITGSTADIGTLGTPALPGETAVAGPAGPPGQSVTVTAEPPGANCTNGGNKLVSVSGTHYVCNGVGGGVNDGDKTDITVSGAGTTWTIDPGAVTSSKLRDSTALSVIGRPNNSVGPPTDIFATAASGYPLRESGSILAFGPLNSAGIGNGAITDAKLASPKIDAQATSPGTPQASANFNIDGNGLFSGNLTGAPSLVASKIDLGTRSMNATPSAGQIDNRVGFRLFGTGSFGLDNDNRGSLALISLTGATAWSSGLKITHTNTAAGDSTGLRIDTVVDSGAGGAGMQVVNDGYGDAVYLAARGPVGPVTTTSTVGLGVDLNRSAVSPFTAERNSLHKGFGIGCDNFSTTDPGAGYGSFCFSGRNMGTSYSFPVFSGQSNFRVFQTAPWTNVPADTAGNPAYTVMDSSGIGTPKAMWTHGGWFGIGITPAAPIHISSGTNTQFILRHNAAGGFAQMAFENTAGTARAGIAYDNTNDYAYLGNATQSVLRWDQSNNVTFAGNGIVSNNLTGSPTLVAGKIDLGTRSMSGVPSGTQNLNRLGLTFDATGQLGYDTTHGGAVIKGSLTGATSFSHLIELNHTNTSTVGDSSAIYLTTNVDLGDRGAGMAIRNIGHADSLYIGAEGNGTGSALGIGIDVNRQFGTSLENNSTAAGIGALCVNWTTSGNFGTCFQGANVPGSNLNPIFVGQSNGATYTGSPVSAAGDPNAGFILFNSGGVPKFEAHYDGTVVGTRFTGPATALRSATTDVSVNTDTPAAGECLQATSSTVAVWGPCGSGGGVTSVGLALPGEFTVTGSPVTGAGTLTGAWATESQGTFLAAPAGGPGTPSFRSISVTDMPIFGASGVNHWSGAVPDPGAVAGTTAFLREDATWVDTSPASNLPVGTGRTISTTAPVSGGGDLSADRTLSISTNGITDALFRQGAAASVVGRSAATGGNVADIATVADGDVLRRSGTTLGFGAIPEASVTNLTTDLAAKVPTTRTISTTAPVTGGGDLSANRTIAVSDFVASGASHARGTVPDPGVTAGTTAFLREDATWVDTSPASNLPVGTGRTLSTTAPLTGGGDLSADRTLGVSITTTNDGGAVVKQAASPGTAQTGNFNVTGAGLAGYFSATTGYIESVGDAQADTDTLTFHLSQNPRFGLYRGRGTKASPAAVTSGDVLGALGYFGQYDTTAAHYNAGAAIQGVAAENFSGTASGSDLVFLTTPATTATLTEKARLTAGGGLLLLGTGAAPYELDIGSSATGGASYARINAPAASDTGVTFASAGTSKWTLYRPGGGALFTIYDEAGTRAHLTLTTGGASQFFGTVTGTQFIGPVKINTTQRLLGRNTAGAGDSEEVTITQAVDWFNCADGAIIKWAAGVPACGADNTSAGGATVTLQGSTPGTPDTGHFNITGTGIAAVLKSSGASPSFYTEPGYSEVTSDSGSAFEAYTWATAGTSEYGVGRGRGSRASPAAVVSADALGSFSFYGGYTTSVGFKAGANLTAIAAENFDATHSGTDLAFLTTPLTTTTPTEKMRLTSAGILRLKGSTSGNVGLKAAAAAGSTDFELPSADGSAGQFLKTNGSGVLSFASAGGGGAWALKTTTYTATTADDVLGCDASGGAFTITLYTASGNGGKKLTVKKTDSSGNICTLDGNASETIDGALTFQLWDQYKVVTIVSDGSNWQVIAPPDKSTTITLASSYTNATTTGTEVSGLTKTLSTGTWYFNYRLSVSSSATGNGMFFGVNFNGTNLGMSAQLTYGSAATTASAGSATGDTNGADGLVEHCAERAESTTAPNLACIVSFDAISGQTLVTITGTLGVTAAGSLQLYSASETTGTVTIDANYSHLIVTRVAS